MKDIEGDWNFEGYPPPLPAFEVPPFSSYGKAKKCERVYYTAMKQLDKVFEDSDIGRVVLASPPSDRISWLPLNTIGEASTLSVYDRTPRNY